MLSKSSWSLIKSCMDPYPSSWFLMKSSPWSLSYGPYHSLDLSPHLLNQIILIINQIFHGSSPFIVILNEIFTLIIKLWSLSFAWSFTASLKPNHPDPLAFPLPFEPCMEPGFAQSTTPNQWEDDDDRIASMCDIFFLVNRIISNLCLA